MSEPLIGEIMLFGGNFAPRGWALCDGAMVSIQSNTALFAILGTVYGGNGTTTFALPDLRGRVPVGAGAGPGLTIYPQGATGGVEQVTLIASQVAPHTHTATHLSLAGVGASGNQPLPGPTVVLAGGTASSKSVNGYSDATPNTSMKPGCVSGSVDANAGGAAHENRQPFLAMNYCIAVQGIFPSRN